jgi:hypothetical protein
MELSEESHILAHQINYHLYSNSSDLHGINLLKAKNAEEIKEARSKFAREGALKANAIMKKFKLGRYNSENQRKLGNISVEKTPPEVFVAAGKKSMSMLSTEKRLEKCQNGGRGKNVGKYVTKADKMLFTYRGSPQTHILVTGCETGGDIFEALNSVFELTEEKFPFFRKKISRIVQTSLKNQKDVKKHQTFVLSNWSCFVLEHNGETFYYDLTKLNSKPLGYISYDYITKKTNLQQVDLGKANAS